MSERLSRLQGVMSLDAAFPAPWRLSSPCDHVPGVILCF